MIEIVKGSVVNQQVDAIVNAANVALAGGGGVDGAIHRAAGPELKAATDKLYPGGCPTGEARITDAFGIKNARHVIHAVGPVYLPQRPERCASLLASAYKRSCDLALEAGDKSIAFPCISCGVYGYPFADALRVAYRALAPYADKFERIVLCMFQKREQLEARRVLADFDDVKFA